MPFSIIRNDITRVTADAIVNTANPQPIYGAGTDQAIYEAAGKDKLLKARQKIGPMRPGQAAVTPAYQLSAKYIIHTVGPIWVDGQHGEATTLRQCYQEALRLAEEKRCRSIAFPLIAAGSYGFPKEEALSIALQEIRAFLMHSDMQITLVVFDRTVFQLSEKLREGIRSFIDDAYVERHTPTGIFGGRFSNARRSEAMPQPIAFEEAEAVYEARPEPTASVSSPKPAPQALGEVKAKKISARKLSDLPLQVGETFQQRLFRLIDERELKDAEVYKRANLDKKLFSKIRCKKDYKPKKETVLALSIALELNLDETKDLLARAGLALSPSSIQDLILEYFIEEEVYDIFMINSALFEHDQPLLGSF